MSTKIEVNGIKRCLSTDKVTLYNSLVYTVETEKTSLKIMEKHLFSITFMLNCLVLLLSFTGVISTPVMPIITDVMKNDTNLCNTSKFLYDSKYTKLCASLEYPINPSDFAPKTVNNFLCLGVYDTAYKICQYSNQFQTSFNNTAFNLYIKNLVFGDNEEQSEKNSQQFCKNLGELTLSYNKTRSYLKPLIEILNNPKKCQKICFDFNNKLLELCAVLGWIRSVENDMTKNDFKSISQMYNESFKNKKTFGVTKMSEEKEKEIKEPIEKHTTIYFGNNDKKFKQNISSTNVPSMKTKPYFKMTSNLEESVKDKTQKTVQSSDTLVKVDKGNNIIDNTSGTDVEIAQGNKNMSANNDGNDVPKKDDEGKSEDFKKIQNIWNVKTTTLSENTQDHYETNLDDIIETGDTNDADDTVQQPNQIGNANENVPETFEKNNLRFPNLRTEDDSHFFTYFTVIAVMCIIGYIGYCNKQKIFAIVLEGRRSKNNRNRRRPSTASYRKLDCTLEEAVTSQCNANVTHVIY